MCAGYEDSYAPSKIDRIGIHLTFFLAEGSIWFGQGGKRQRRGLEIKAPKIL
jgi:hypothetical protein